MCGGPRPARAFWLSDAARRLRRNTSRSSWNGCIRSRCNGIYPAESAAWSELHRVSNLREPVVLTEFATRLGLILKGRQDLEAKMQGQDLLGKVDPKKGVLMKVAYLGLFAACT